jgi:DNA-binding XRE family transcriptional regulator
MPRRTRADSPTWWAELGTAIRTIRRSAGLKQSELGAAIGVSAGSICGLEAGRQRIDAYQLLVLAAALGTTPGVLLAAPPCPVCAGRPPAGMTCGDCGARTPADYTREPQR